MGIALYFAGQRDISVSDLMSNIRHLLDQKLQKLISCRPQDSLTSVAKQMSAANAGSVAAMNEDGTLFGILSERDIVRAVASHSGLVDSIVARDWMTTLVPSCAPEDTDNSALRKISEARSCYIAVVENGKTIGIISLGDLVSHRLQEIDLLMKDVNQEADDQLKIMRFTQHVKAFDSK